ncbi:MAG: hypothetical protein CSB33_02590 [Desulfobacterales bacterium]|nr:MAG: hypothetical protein CSB33_02590 [Desulfobacterales bacterium]
MTATLRRFPAAIGLLFLGCLVFLSASPASAASLVDDYHQLVAQRQKLEAERKKYEAEQARLAAQQKSLLTLFFQCISRQKKDLWEEKVSQADAITKKIEEMRLKLPPLRKEIDKNRKELEKERQAIEARHTHKGPGTPYELDFRHYIKGLQDRYFHRLASELFPGYEAYIREMAAYNQFLKDSVGLCMGQKID